MYNVISSTYVHASDRILCNNLYYKYLRVTLGCIITRSMIYTSLRLVTRL